MAPRVAPRSPDPNWRETFVEEFGAMSMEMGAPRTMARIIAWMLVCDPPDQSSKDLQVALRLSAAAVSSEARMLIGAGILERTTRAGERRIFYRLRSGTWDGVLEARLRLLVRIREVTERGLLLAGDEADARLRDVRDIYEWFVEELEELLRTRRTIR
jgi:DNA-binding transcriptional regulator GbsR (MarR family)